MTELDKAEEGLRSVYQRVHANLKPRVQADLQVALDFFERLRAVGELDLDTEPLWAFGLEESE